MRTRTWIGAVLVGTTAVALVATGLPGAFAAPVGAPPIGAAARVGVAPIAAAPIRTSVVADLRADVDRNGVVDVTGNTDEAGEHVWTAARGAIFLANLDDDSRRCPRKSPAGKPLSDAALEKCNDAADTIVNGSIDAADLARLRTVPMSRAGRSATATVAVSGAGAAARTRVFVRSGKTWKLLKATTKLTTAQVRAGVELGIEATDIIRKASTWNGLATVKLTVTDGPRKSADTVVLKVAPLLTHHPVQRAQTVLVTRKNGTSPDAKESQRFVTDLRREVEAAGITDPVFAFSYPRDSEAEDIWAQDFFEPAYLSMPGAGGKPVGMRILLRSPQNHLPSGRPSGRQLYERLRGPGVGVVEVRGMKTSEDWSLSSMGNLETIPPYGPYRAGRIVMGQRSSKVKPSAALLSLLAAQGAQSPLLLDTSFLAIAHVDEFVHFVPANTPRGWRIAIADPDAGMAVLRAVAAGGSGAVKLTSAPKRPELWGNPPDTTVAQALADPGFVADNTLAATKIKANIALLKKATGVTDAEFVRVPMLFHQACDDCADGAFASARITPRAAAAAPPRSLVARLPSAVNGVLLAPDRYLAPKQFGPVVGGVDVFAAAVTEAYRAAGVTVSYVDDWYAYHAGKGDIHCGTNVLRAYPAPWWVH
jgi:protein-arginine deiminase